MDAFAGDRQLKDYPPPPPASFTSRPPRWKKKEKKPDGPSWKFRRRIFGIVIIYAIAVLSYILLEHAESTSRLLETFVLGAYGLIAGVIATYGATAVWQDIKLWGPAGYEREQYDEYPHRGS